MALTFTKDVEKYMNPQRRTNPRGVAALVIPHPSHGEVEKYLKKWNMNVKWREQDVLLRKLFTETYPLNTSISEIVDKVTLLDKVYHTRLSCRGGVYSVARHIISLDIDQSLQAGDASLVGVLMRIKYEKDGKICHANEYSFSTKYCSFHNPDAFPIYDNYVNRMLEYFRDNDRFSVFGNDELKNNYPKFKQVLADFRRHYGLEKYTTKELDQYLWQLGDEFLSR